MLHHPITRPATQEQVDQRSYTVTYNPLFERRGTPWMVRAYGAGHWCRADGEPHYFASEEAANAAGARWLIEGKR